MKRKIFSLSLQILFTLLFSCQSDSGKKESDPMTQFLGMFNGSASQVAFALEKFGASPEIIKNDMALYPFKNPKIIKKKGNCYLVELDIGIAVKIYEICWKDGKIVKINDIGLK